MFSTRIFNENLLRKYIDNENNTLYLLYNGSKLKDSNTLIFKRDYIKEMLTLRTPLFEDENGVIISIPDESKCGLSIYNYDRSLNLYGLKDFVDKLPTANINKEDLLGYEIISL